VIERRTTLDYAVMARFYAGRMARPDNALDLNDFADAAYLEALQFSRTIESMAKTPPT
jgi:hypothetical protein